MVMGVADVEVANMDFLEVGGDAERFECSGC